MNCTCRFISTQYLCLLFLLSHTIFAFVCFSLFHGHCSASLVSEVLGDVHPLEFWVRLSLAFRFLAMVHNFYVGYAARIYMISKCCTGCLVSMDELSLWRSRGSAFSELFIHSWLIEPSISLLHANGRLITAEVGFTVGYDMPFLLWDCSASMWNKQIWFLFPHAPFHETGPRIWLCLVRIFLNLSVQCFR